MFSCTYDPADNKLRLYASSRLDTETYQRVKKAGYRWAPKQELFFSVWNPGAEDIAVELAGEIEDEDTTLVERAEERAERFKGYRENRTRDAESAQKAVAQIADGIPMGQPILIGHHSDRRARKDAERIESGMRRAVKMWDQASYWQDRAAGALRNAKYKELPSVRARRIKTLEADLRKAQRNVADATKSIARWKLITDKPEAFKKPSGEPVTDLERAMTVANVDGYFSMAFPLADYPRDPPASQYEGAMGLWSALKDGVIGPAKAQELAIAAGERSKAWGNRWVSHYENRLIYERAMLNEAGGTVADRSKPEKGGAVRCWASPGFGKGWAVIQKVNKASVSVLDNWNNGGRNFTRTIPFDKLTAVMSAAEVAEAREQGQLIEDQAGTGFFLKKGPEPSTTTPEPAPPKAVEAAPSKAEGFEAMRASLASGVKAVAVPQLFQTPPDVAQQVIAAAEIRPGHRVLEPSAGMGALLAAMPEDTDVVAIESDQGLAKILRAKFPGVLTFNADFLRDCGTDEASSQIVLQPAFDRIIMNPPFAARADVEHVMNAMRFLRPDGKLVSIMSAGVTFRQDKMTADFRNMVKEHNSSIHPLPAGCFKQSGTDVRAVMVVIEGGPG